MIEYLSKMYSYQDIFGDKNKILFVTAHPDDVDVFFGGTLCKLNQDKKKTFVLVVTNGGRGSKGVDISEEELAKQRLNEERSALKILGVKKDNFATLNYLDGEVENNMKLIGEIAEVIRRFNPQIVCTHEPHEHYFKRNDVYRVNHRDHRHTGLAVLDAVYPFSRDRSFFKEHLKRGLSPYTVHEILFGGSSEVNAKIDISKVIEKKKAALLSHKSQFSQEVVERIIGFFQEDGHYFESGNYIKLAH